MLIGLDRVKEWSEESGELSFTFLMFQLGLQVLVGLGIALKYQIKCNSYSGDLEPDDILISTHVDEIMSRFCWFSNGLSVVTIATCLFCTLAMPLPSLTRAEVKSNRSALHQLRWCQTDGLLRTGDLLSLATSECNLLSSSTEDPLKNDIFFAIN